MKRITLTEKISTSIKRFGKAAESESDERYERALKQLERDIIGLAGNEAANARMENL